MPGERSEHGIQRSHHDQASREISVEKSRDCPRCVRPLRGGTYLSHDFLGAGRRLAAAMRPAFFSEPHVRYFRPSNFPANVDHVSAKTRAGVSREILPSTVLLIASFGVFLGIFFELGFAIVLHCGNPPGLVALETSFLRLNYPGNCGNYCRGEISNTQLALENIGIGIMQCRCDHYQSQTQIVIGIANHFLANVLADCHDHDENDHKVRHINHPVDA